MLVSQVFLENPSNGRQIKEIRQTRKEKEELGEQQIISTDREDQTEISTEMEESYLSYAMSVIVARALRCS